MTVSEIFNTMEYGPSPEAKQLAVEWLEAHGSSFTHYIGGKFTEPATGEYFDTVNPATGQVLARVAQGSAADVDRAVSAARAAQDDWAALRPHARARYLYALARQLQKHSRLFAVLETLDNGKSIRETRDLDIPLAARHFYHHAGWAQLLDSEFPDHVPAGVCGQIIPWNFPLLMLSWKVAPALAAGCTVVLKPAEYTPLTALLFAEITRHVGLPAGVFNLVTGDGRTGELIVEHDGIDKLAFTGSTEVGRLIRAESAGSGKKLSLELGGKSPFIVFADADIDAAVEGVVDGIWLNQGQVCCAGSRLLVQEGIAEEVYARLRRRMSTLRVGDPLDKSVDIGAIIAPVQLQRIEELVATGRAEGATCWQPDLELPGEGLFYPPTLFTDVEPAAEISQVEIFGPVLVASTFRTPDEAVELANHTRYGLAASVWSENIDLALDMASRIKAGIVWVNSTNLFDAAAGFGGYKESGYGREGGREGMYEYLVPRWEQELKRSTQLEAASAEPVIQSGPGEPGEPAGESSGPAATPAAQAAVIRDSFGGFEATLGEEYEDLLSGGLDGVLEDFTVEFPAEELPGEAAAGLPAEAAAPESLALPVESTAAEAAAALAPRHTAAEGLPAIDRTPKLYIGGKQVRPDGGYSYAITSRNGVFLGEVGLGNRKDIRNAVEAARKASAWSSSTGHNRAQILYYLAENMAERAAELSELLDSFNDHQSGNGAAEVAAALERTYTYAALADKYDGQVHQTPLRNVTLAMPEPWGVLGLVSPSEAPLLGMLSLLLPALAMGNRTVLIPSPAHALIIAPFYQLLDTSDVPAGTVNIVTGNRDELARTLAEHDDVNALWYFGGAQGSEMVERASIGNLKYTWTSNGLKRDWFNAEQGQGREFLRRATQVKNIWVPYGE
jgi:acyl-CoA reductase-like NAD-dependent aldehyde dehydrogenase